MKSGNGSHQKCMLLTMKNHLILVDPARDDMLTAGKDLKCTFWGQSVSGSLV